MAPSKKKKVVIPKPDIPALVPADCHIGKRDVEDGAEQGLDTAGLFFCKKVENVPFSASELQVQQRFETWEPQHFVRWLRTVHDGASLKL